MPKPKPPDTEAVVALLKYLGETDIRLWAAVRLAATTAARRSELIALKWSDLSWGKATLQLERGIVVVPGKGSIDTDTKTGEAGEGLLDLDEELMTALQIIRQEDGPDDLPLHKWPDGYILSNDRGVTHWHPDTLSSRVREAASHVHRAKGITLKQLRSYVASELATSLNFDVATAQAVLRHKSSSTTLRHYIAARERDSRQASRTIGEALADGKSKSSRENFTWMKDYKPLAPKKKS
ncbi:MAG TPA: tyrosine-type recombinase/integrase [Acidimicrobiales bacterium]|nr:tyrosine-type recombinase/integrase [Acidimicrobiales bacterium]